jgi:hypothetical protein
MRIWIGLSLAAVLAGCGKPAEAPKAEAPAEVDAPVAAPTPPPAPDRSAWAGRWNGPEGLFLQVEPLGAARYRLVLKDSLDSQATYDAEATADGLRFVRAGESLTIRPGAGADTGFKWLADKTDCLIVVAGREGYCRD